MDYEKQIKNLVPLLITKWLSVAYSILIVLVAGASYNLFAYFQLIGELQGYGGFTRDVIKYTVLLGYYVGVIPGLIVSLVAPWHSFLIAAIMTLISFTSLGYLSGEAEGSNFNWFWMMVMLFFGAMSGVIASVTAIVTTVRNFGRLVCMFIVVILVSYYKVGYYFEFSVRKAFFDKTELQSYIIGMGFVITFIFAVGMFAVRLANIQDALDNVMRGVSRVALLFFLLAETIFIALFFVVGIVKKDYFWSSLIFFLIILVNFLIVVFVIWYVYNTVISARSNPIPLAFEVSNFHNMNYGEYLTQIKFVCLIFASAIVVGTWSTFRFNVGILSQDEQLFDNLNAYVRTLWISDIFARIFGGLLAFFLVTQVNGYLFLVGGGVLSWIGFLLAFLSSYSGEFLFFACIFIGVGEGLFWVIAPQISIDDAGPKHFGLNWGTILFANSLGMIFFGYLFQIIYNWMKDGGSCSGGAWENPQFMFFGVLWLTAAVLVYISYLNDDPADYMYRGAKEKSAKKEDQKKKTHDKKEKPRDKSRSKSKGKKDASRTKDSNKYDSNRPLKDKR